MCAPNRDVAILENDDRVQGVINPVIPIEIANCDNFRFSGNNKSISSENVHFCIIRKGIIVFSWLAHAL